MFFENDVFITINNRNKDEEKKLDKLKTVKEILEYSKKVITHEYFFELLDKRIWDNNISIESFRTLVLFVSSLNELTPYRNLLVCRGVFVMNWRMTDDVLPTIRFNKDYMVSYVIPKGEEDWYKGTCYALDVMSVIEEIVDK